MLVGVEVGVLVGVLVGVEVGVLVGVFVGVGVGVPPPEPVQTFPLIEKLVGAGLLVVHEPLKPGSELTVLPAGTEPLYDRFVIETF
ncbi:hypothetical protein KSB_02470 [Ktedonobacter robiniae]|uniref:Secreted protein n=1 Tax=Ktedonobacter robiniae TaxID=2778365 RepID=A0ABQ3UGD5_9CHLR|nr:hypothetical protein KSB_02470 [Ktedonobacter robiniae]